MIAISLLLFPKLALGLSGFETGVAVASHVRGRPDDDPNKPRGRIFSTRMLLISAAAIMSIFLMGSVGRRQYAHRAQRNHSGVGDG